MVLLPSSVVSNSSMTLQEKVFSFKEKIRSLVFIESVLQSSVPLCIDCIHRSIEKNQPVLVLCLEFSVQQWQTWLNFSLLEQPSLLQFLNLRPLFQNFETDPEDFFQDLYQYIHSSLSLSKNSTSSCSTSSLFILLDSIDAMMLNEKDTLISFLRFLSTLHSKASIFFAFNPTLHSSTLVTALQHVTQASLWIHPLPRTQSEVESNDLFLQCQSYSVHSLQARCEFYLKRPRGQFIHEQNVFQLTLSTPSKTKVHSPSFTMSSTPLTSLFSSSTSSSSSRIHFTSLIQPYKEAVSNVNKESDIQHLNSNPSLSNNTMLSTGSSSSSSSSSFLVNDLEKTTSIPSFPTLHTTSFASSLTNSSSGHPLSSFSPNPTTSSSSSKSMIPELEGLTFDLSLTPRQKEAKDNVKLPYLEVQSKFNRGGSQSEGGGWIDYSYDVNDDFDEEDPDADLEF